MARQRASAMRCCWPPESWRGSRSPNWRMWTRSSIASTRGAIFVARPLVRLQAVGDVLRARSYAETMRSSGTRCRRRGGSATGDRPARRRTARGPSVWRMKPDMMRSSVDFPQPEGPSSATSSPPAISRSTSLTATKSLKRWVMLSSRSRCPQFFTIAGSRPIFNRRPKDRRITTRRQRVFRRKPARIDTLPCEPTLAAVPRGAPSWGLRKTL